MNLVVVQLDIRASVSNRGFFAGSKLWCLQHRCLVVANRGHEGVEVLEVHPVDESDHTTVLAEVLFALALVAVPESVVLRCHLHVHTTMSVWARVAPGSK